MGSSCGGSGEGTAPCAHRVRRAVHSRGRVGRAGAPRNHGNGRRATRVHRRSEPGRAHEHLQRRAGGQKETTTLVRTRRRGQSACAGAGGGGGTQAPGAGSARRPGSSGTPPPERRSAGRVTAERTRPPGAAGAAATQPSLRRSTSSSRSRRRARGTRPLEVLVELVALLEVLEPVSSQSMPRPPPSGSCDPSPIPELVHVGLDQRVEQELDAVPPSIPQGAHGGEKDWTAPSGRGRARTPRSTSPARKRKPIVAGLDRQTQVVDLVTSPRRRGHRQRRRLDDRHAYAAVLGGPQHGDPRRLAAGDPLRVHAGRHEQAVLGRLDRGSPERELHEPHAGPGGAGRAHERPARRRCRVNRGTSRRPPAPRRATGRARALPRARGLRAVGT